MPNTPLHGYDGFDARWAVSPPVTDEQLREIPARRGVVLLTRGEAGDEAPIVMITAASMRSRTRTRLAESAQEADAPTRKRDADLREITGAIWYKRCESHFETDWQYLELSRAVWPGRYAKMISWKGPWFVGIVLSDRHPYFYRTREPFAKAEARCVGPFRTAREAEAFIEGLQDAFDLCRSISCLRQAPGGPRCAYAQMGRCVSPADGTISMEDYREILTLAADFAAGDHETLRAKLATEMAEAARALQFEQAGAIKTRLERLKAFEQEAYRFVRPAEQFRYLLVQPGAGVHELRLFFVQGGHVTAGGTLAYPMEFEALDASCKAMQMQAEGGCKHDSHEYLRMGLVTRTLFASGASGGVAFPWPATAEEIEEAITDQHELLGVRERPTPTPKATETTETPDAAETDDTSETPGPSGSSEK